MPVTVVDAQVGTADLRRALISVLPHISRDEQIPVLMRARMWIDPEHLIIGATDRFTAGLARVSVWSQTFPAHGVIDLTADDLMSILQVHKAVRESVTDFPQWQVRVSLLDKTRAGAVGADGPELQLTVTDATGLFEGTDARRSVDVVPLPPEQGFPDVRMLVASKLRTQIAWPHTEFGANMEYLARFGKAQKAYSTPTALAHAKLFRTSPVDRRGLVTIAVGDSFVGCLSPVVLPEGDSSFTGDMASWSACLPDRGEPDQIPLPVEPMERNLNNADTDLLLRSVCARVVRLQFADPASLAARFGVRAKDAAWLLDQLAGVRIVAHGSDVASCSLEARKVLWPADRVDDALAELGPAPTPKPPADTTGDGKAGRAPFDLRTASGALLAPGEPGSGDAPGPNSDADLDPPSLLPDTNQLLLDAAQKVIETQFGAAAQLQRVLNIPLARAYRLLDELEALGIVGPAPGGLHAREVLYPVERLGEALTHIITTQEGDQ